MENREPSAVNALPPIVIVMFLVVVLTEGYFAGAEAGLWGAFNSRQTALLSYSYQPDLFEFALNTSRWSWDIWMRFLTYPFLHGSFLAAAIGSAFLLAMGKFVGEVLGNFAVVAIFYLSAIGGALIYTLLLDDSFPLFGLYPAAYGLIGAFTYVLFSQAEGLLRQQVVAFRLLGFLMVINLVFAVIFPGPNTWVAEFAGAFVGFFSAAMIRPGGIKVLIAKLRR